MTQHISTPQDTFPASLRIWGVVLLGLSNSDVTDWIQTLGLLEQIGCQLPPIRSIYGQCGLRTDRLRLPLRDNRSVILSLGQQIEAMTEFTDFPDQRFL